jgi:putative peptide zinc metalloprotease protein
MHRWAGPSSGHPASSASGSVEAVATLPAPSATGSGATLPQLAPGVERLGEYQGSGLTEATYLARNSRGQVVHLSRLLYLVLSEIDGSRAASEIAGQASVAFGRTVSADNVEYLLTNKLAPLGLLATSERARPGARAAGQDAAILALKVRRILVPAPAVQHIARLFQPLFSPLAVASVMACLIVGDAGLFRSARLGSAFRYVLLHPLLMLLVLALSVLSMLFHECGHAAACRYGGARPGVIGMGFYVVWPAFYTNVTDAYRLGRAGRIRTDLGGVYFNAVFTLPLAATYLATGYPPLLAAIMLIHLEILQQLLPSLRFDGYFILADLIGVPDLFRHIAPTLRSMIPGRPADPRVRNLKRAARITLTAWILLVVPLLTFQLVLIILTAPGLVRTFAHSLATQAHAIVAQFGRVDVPAGLVSVISVLLLVLPMAGLCYILLLAGRRTLRLAVTVSRRRPVLGYAFAATAVVLTAALAVHWGILPLGGGGVTRPRPAGSGTVSRPQPLSTSPAAAAAVLTPVSAHGFDALSSPGSDPSDENDNQAEYAIDGDPATAWHTQYYIGSPAFGGLKEGAGLILDMGKQVKLSSVTVTFGATPGADVSIEAGNDNTLAASTLSTFTTVATGHDIGGTYTFKSTRPAAGRYVLIWFTKLPPLGSGKFEAEIFNIGVRGSGAALSRPAGATTPHRHQPPSPVLAYPPWRPHAHVRPPRAPASATMARPHQPRRRPRSAATPARHPAQQSPQPTTSGTPTTPPSASPSPQPTTSGTPTTLPPSTP